MKRLFDGFPYLEVRFFENAGLLKEALNVEIPETIIMDVNMPEMDAYQFLENHTIGEDNFYLMLGAPLKEEKMQWFRDQGCKGFLEKPLNKSKLEPLFNRG